MSRTWTPRPRIRPKPFLKWAGGKTQLLEQFERLLPRKFGRYLEPFVGGGALFFGLRPRRARLTDINAELIDCYVAIRDNVEGVIEALTRHTYEKRHYYRVRKVIPTSLALEERVARTIFLNKASFNGLYRVNNNGQFNVPFGRHKNPLICDEENLRACARLLRGVHLRACDFAHVLNVTRRGDFVYFDPPYAPLSETSAFTSYAPGGFDMTDQKRLAGVFAELADAGVHVMLSNSDVPAIRRLYSGFRIDRVEASRRINSNGQRRGKIWEIVVRNYR